MDVAPGSEKLSQCGNILHIHFICSPTDGDLDYFWTSGPKVVHGKTAKAFLLSLWALLFILAHKE